MPSLARLCAPLSNISAPVHSAPTALSVPTTTDTTLGHAIQLISASSEQRNNKSAFSLATLQSLGLLLRRPYTSCPRRLLRCTVAPEHGETATTDDLEKSLCLGYPRTFEPRACIGIRDNFPLGQIYILMLLLFVFSDDTRSVPSASPEKCLATLRPELPSLPSGLPSCSGSCWPRSSSLVRTPCTICITFTFVARARSRQAEEQHYAPVHPPWKSSCRVAERHWPACVG